MSRLTQIFAIRVPSIRNRDGYPAYERSLEEQYLQTLLTNTIENTYYSDQNLLLCESDRIHDAMLQKDPEFAAKAFDTPEKTDICVCSLFWAW